MKDFLVRFWSEVNHLPWSKLTFQFSTGKTTFTKVEKFIRSLSFPVETFGQSVEAAVERREIYSISHTNRKGEREGEMMSRPRERMGKLGVTATMFETSSDQDAVSPNLSDNLFVSPMLSLRRGHE